jgi:hypothetical protein
MRFLPTEIYRVGLQQMALNFWHDEADEWNSFKEILESVRNSAENAVENLELELKLNSNFVTHY